MAGAVLLGCALGVRAQEPSTEPKRDDAPPAKSASPSDASKSARSRFQRPGEPGYRSGNDATEPSKQAEKEDPKKEEQTTEGKTKPAEGDDQPTQRREPIDPKARVIQFEFAKQPWDTLLETLAEVAGLSLQMEFKPDGTFSYINDPNKYTIGEAIDVINMQLFTKGYTLIHKGNYLKLWPLSQPIEPAWIPRVKPEELDDRGDSEFVSVIFPIESMSAAAAVKEIEGFKGEHGKVTALESANRVMVTDIVANIRLMRDMLNDIQSSGSSLKAKSRTFQLKFVAATKVEATLRDLFGLQPRSALNQPSGRTSGSDRDRGGGDPREIFRRMMEGGGGQPPWMAFGPGGGQPGGDQRGGEGRDSRGGDRGSDPRFGQQTQPTITLAVDETHNQLFVMAPLEKLAIAEEVIKVMDVPREGTDPYKPRVLQTPVITPYRLSDGDAQSLATALNTIYQTTPGVRISADTGNNMVIVTATPDDQEHIKKLVEQFEYDERNSVVLSLSTLDAGSVETLLTAVYASGQRDWRGNTVPRPGQPKVVADRTRNQLMIRGSKKQIDDIRGMLAALGEPQLMGVAGSNTLQVLRMGSGDQKLLMEQLEKFWPVVRPNNNRIEIIDLGKRSRNVAPPAPESDSPEPTDDPRRREPPRRVQPDANEEPTPPPSRIRSKSSGDQQNRTSRDSRTSVKLVSYVAPIDGQQEPDDAVPSKPQSQEPKQMPQADQDGPPVVISVGPDGTIVVGSTDPAAMQSFMNLWRTLTGGGAASGGANYKVFYLDSADATQMQTTLNDLLGVSSFSSFFGGSSSSTATSTLKIVPDARTNSLIVYGSANDLARVEQLIKVLDSSEAPASGAMSSPRIIPVQYANATSVARVIRDVYSSRVVGSSSGFGGVGGSPSFGGGFSPFGSSGGGPGGSSSSRSRSSTQGTLSIGVDEQSNSIVVACSEALYHEIERLVKTLDVAASETQRTVSIVTLKNSTPSAVQEALNGLMGITTSRTSSSRSGDSSSSRGFGGGFPVFGGGMPFGGGFPGGGFQGGISPFGGSFRGGDDRGRSFDGGRGGFGGDFGRGGGDFGRDRRP
jgi:type II secretory pathway component GspD/PulD (secretin)